MWHRQMPWQWTAADAMGQLKNQPIPTLHGAMAVPLEPALSFVTYLELCPTLINSA